MKKQIIIILFFLMALIFIFAHFIFPGNPKTAEINGHTFKLEPSVSEEDREKGLSGRDNLCRECAMLFVFSEKGIYPFWMKDMKFNLDIIWIDEGKIVYLVRNIPYEKKSTINPDCLADRVLEINAGLSDEYGIKTGDGVKFQ